MRDKYHLLGMQNQKLKLKAMLSEKLQILSTKHYVKLTRELTLTLGDLSSITGTATLLKQIAETSTHATNFVSSYLSLSNSDSS